MKLTLPLPPNLANGRMHWRVKQNRKKAYSETLDTLRQMKRIPEPKPVTGKAVIAATLYLYAPMDDDNAMARVKWPVDWLVTNGYIAGDSRKHIEWAGLPRQVIDRKNQRVELAIEPIAA